MSGRFAAEKVFRLYSDAKLLADLAEEAHRAVQDGNVDRASNALVEALRRYGDLIGLRMALTDAASSVGDLLLRDMRG